MTPKTLAKKTEMIVCRGRAADVGELSEMVRAMDACREPGRCRSASALLAAWCAARLLAESPIAKPVSPELLRAELTAFIILAGNPFVTALGEMFWVWGAGCTDDEWRAAGTNTEFGGMSHRDCLLTGFRENANRVLPVIKLAREWGLQHEDMKRLVAAEVVIRRISDRNDATATENEWLNTCLMPVYNHLSGLVESHQVPWVPGLDSRGRDRTTSHLLKWSNPWLLGGKHGDGSLQASRRVGGLVQLLSVVLSLEKGKHHDLAGKVLSTLRHWEMPIVGGWIARQLGEALNAGSEQYAGLVGSLPASLDMDVKSPLDKHPELDRELRQELTDWYESSVGQDLRDDLRDLFKVARRCARALQKELRPGNSDLWLTQEEIMRLPDPLRSQREAEIRKLSRKRGEQIQQILGMGSPRHAAHAIWLAEKGVLGRLWLYDDVDRCIRYKYRT